jgi:plastocyanin
MGLSSTRRWLAARRHVAATVALVSVGDRVQWRNVGQIAHTVTTTPSKVADPARVSVPNGAQPWNSGLIGGDDSFSRTLDEPGTYRYVCIPHEGAGMVGTVVVEE